MFPERVVTVAKARALPGDAQQPQVHDAPANPQQQYQISGVGYGSVTIPAQNCCFCAVASIS